MNNNDQALIIHWMEIEKLIPYAKNAKQHPPEQVAQIAASIQAFGFNDPIAIDEDNILIEGHGRLLAAQKLGLERVPVISLSHLSSVEKKAYILAHNKLTMNTGWEPEMLRVEFEALQEEDFPELSLTGFRKAEIDILLEDPSIPDMDPDPEIFAGNKAKPVTCPKCGESLKQ